MTRFMKLLILLALLSVCAREHGRSVPRQPDTVAPGGNLSIVNLETGLPMSGGHIRVDRAGAPPPTLVFEKDYRSGESIPPLPNGAYRIAYEPPGQNRIGFPNFASFRSTDGKCSVALKVSTHQVSQQVTAGKELNGFEGMYEILLRVDERVFRHSDWDGPTDISIGVSDQIIPLLLPIGVGVEANALLSRRQESRIEYLLPHASWVSAEANQAVLEVAGGKLHLSVEPDSSDRILQLMNGRDLENPSRLQSSFNLPLLQVEGYCQLVLPAGVASLEARGLPTGSLHYQLYARSGELLAESSILVE